MRRIGSLRKLHNRANPILSGHCCRGRTHLSAIRFMLNGPESGSRARKACTYGRLTTPYRRDTLENYMGTYPGTARHSWLSSYRKKIGYSDNDRCECGAQETVAHVEDALNSVSSLLGGSNEGEKGKPKTVSRVKTVRAVLDFAEASQRSRSSAS
ncbi:arylsulfatase [Penicillium atrosanguineum]|uniref:arylsulfatase n=1 Tax=Penicillium atrosanguineum TaxID=1132637 RepID=UPI002399FDD8|nr:arylsulfatase [Penicillium atrosanguineum]KAJ5296499.1 arylsulfatase [Penicillium atrosanguineum]